MDAWGDIRIKARDCYKSALAEAGGDRKTAAIVAAALKLDDLQLERYEPGTIVGKGVHGFLDRTSLMVYVANDKSPEDEAVVIAHEIGHFKLHRDPRSEVTAIAGGLGGDSIDSGAGRVQGYSPRERKEVQADIFAGEFLCPSDWLRAELMAGKKPRDVAKDLGLPPGLVMNQAVRALLLPAVPATPEVRPIQAIELDESQLEAAAWDKGPLLVDAGPGTGKTRTLVHRIQAMLEKGVSPASILALTFSNKAAEEMRERLSAANAEAAIEMWVGTFHAFGLELLTKYHERIGRTIKLHTLDEAGSLALLEDNLTRLPLRYFQNLYEPAYELVHVLRAISRCKDELITPETYKVAAEAAFAAANDAQREDAEKALEVAAIYEIYQDLLRGADAVDFGDLVMLSAGVLEQHADIRAECQGRFEHILVDEYQDVNLASARLLKALSPPGGDAWVVADQRQSIYRFRGAAPTNVQRFTTEFSGQQRSLKVNYRSGSPVVGAFQTFAATMKLAGGSWTPKRGNVGAVVQVYGPSLAAEAAAIRAHIEHVRKNGIPYSDQAILARSHLTLARITGVLEQLGVPLLYLGDLFERPEVRDLLSLISIDAEWGGAGLVRVAQLPEYGVSRADALCVIAWAKEKHIALTEALGRTAEIEGLSEDGRAGLKLLGSHLKGVTPGTTPWTLLTTWLFERSAYLMPLLAANESKAQQQLIAIYQLLKICGEMAASGYSTRKRFLARVRRIEALNDDRIYRAVSSEASGMDAVRVMTIHGSKGLEFKAVHLPALATRYMPSNRQAIRCPPPPTLAHLAIRPEDHEAEEECLFFVALSRARDFLFLSRAERYTTQNSSASKFLKPLASLAPEKRCGDGVLVTGAYRPVQPQAAQERYDERELSLYIQCPARYRYEIKLGLRGVTDDAPYIRFHRCVYRTVGWIESQRSAGQPASAADARAELARQWEAGGPVGHGFENYYRASAEGMIASMVEVIAAETGTYDRDEWEVDIDGRKIAVTPDRVIISASGTVHVQRIRTGRKTKSEPDNRIYALLRAAAASRYGRKPVVIETFYLATRETIPVLPRKDAQLLAEYRDAITEIERGEFSPAPEDARRCPNCQCYFLCDYVQGVS